MSSRGNSLKKSLDSALATALHALGPAQFLQAIPLTLPVLSRGPDGQVKSGHVSTVTAAGLPTASAVAYSRLRSPSGPPNLWLLPFLRSHLANGGWLQYWRDSLYPIAQELSASLPIATDATKAQLHTLLLQIWALLPAFADAPVDTASVRNQSIDINFTFNQLTLIN